MSIPLLAIPVINRPDLLAECLASIDHPVDRLVVIDNSPDGIMTGEAYDRLSPDIEDLFVAEPPANLGYGASVNFAIRTHPALPWWCIANADITFGPGDLAKLEAEMAQGGPRWVGINGDYRFFGLTAEAVDRAGFFDENFHPAYCEDADYEWRCHLTGVQRHFIEGTTTHVGSVGYRDNPRARNHVSYPENVAYYLAKWGGPLRGGERFTTPFDSGASPASWTLDRRRLAVQSW